MPASLSNAPVPTDTLQCDSDLYDYCVKWTQENESLNCGLRVDALVKPSFVRVDFEYPLSIYETMVHSGPFVQDAQELTQSYNATDAAGVVQVPLKFADDVVEFFSNVYFQQSNS